MHSCLAVVLAPLLLKLSQHPAEGFHQAGRKTGNNA
jgi:hypothetical protein